MEEPLRLKKLKRYTHLPQLLHMLRTRTITLLAPATWEDQNDTYYLARYKDTHPDIKSLLVLCLTDASDTYHHWRVYAGEPSGVQIRFNPQAFSKWVSTHPNARLGRARYLHVDDFRESATDLELPFLKRMAFRDEDEIRLILEDYENEGLLAFSLPFDLTIIEEIKLSPWLAPSLVDTVIQTLADSYKGPKRDWKRIEIGRTSLLANSKVMSV